jgi:hypothetical protein
MDGIIENSAKMLFASRLLSEKGSKIYQLQEQTAADWDLFDSGQLTRQLAGGGNISIYNDGKSVMASFRYLAYTRFLDMKDPRRSNMREGYHLYNRILWGVLYNEILPQLKYGYVPQVREQMEAEIKWAMDSGYIDNN